MHGRDCDMAVRGSGRCKLQTLQFWTSTQENMAFCDIQPAGSVWTRCMYLLYVEYGCVTSTQKRAIWNRGFVHSAFSWRALVPKTIILAISMTWLREGVDFKYKFGRPRLHSGHQPQLCPAAPERRNLFILAKNCGLSERARPVLLCQRKIHQHKTARVTLRVISRMPMCDSGFVNEYNFCSILSEDCCCSNMHFHRAICFGGMRTDRKLLPGRGVAWGLTFFWGGALHGLIHLVIIQNHGSWCFPHQKRASQQCSQLSHLCCLPTGRLPGRPGPSHSRRNAHWKDRVVDNREHLKRCASTLLLENDLAVSW